MAATSTHPGDSILAIGETGKSLMAAFTRLITYRKVHDRRLENLYATLSLTTNMLTELGTTINTYESDFRIKDEVTGPICETAKTNLERLLVMVNEGNANGVWKNDGTIGGLTVTAEADPWFLITMALGGREEAKMYWKSLDDTRDTLLELNDIIKYRILKTLSDKNALKPDQVEEFNKLTSLLPHILQSLEKAEKGKKLEAEAAARKKKQESDRKAAATMPDLSRRESNVSDMTLIVEPTRKRTPFVKDVDCDSILSVSSSDSDSFIDIPEIYEEWSFRWNEPIKNVNRSWGFLGIKFKSYFEDTGFWATDSEYRTQGEMKEQHQFAAGDLSPDKHKEAMQKAIQAIPNKIGFEVDNLIETRTDASSHEGAKRQWTVVAVRPQQKYPYGSAKKWGKDPKYTNWLVTIKGETVDKVERSRALTRRDDPWRKQRGWSPRSRSPRRRYPIIHDRPRSSYSPVRIPMPRPSYRGPPGPPPPPVFAREAIPDEGFRQGNIVIGKILSKEEAVKKMDEVWEEMTTVKETVEAKPTVD
ncbi:hypothetical protein ONS95_009400 [Cadophora gregata]|uniref:uncharacterized protein n=1 Tax=Cadophora gregata TaxID=51156 RepID=UPI0026DBECA9|nr:uncharacterized protein ONS95_009400 [Cadophora gregata]KAK0124444.1 hypothetical protein ONS95_009400 [Cadophora gregata]KAK0129700.1 hypothetical protein ONS96_000262 [Cadophora gregata f. sp. sojae]